MDGSGRAATLDVTNMDCAVRAIAVRKALKNVPGVNSAKVALQDEARRRDVRPGKDDAGGADESNDGRGLSVYGQAAAVT